MIYQGLECTIKTVVSTLCVCIRFGKTAVKDMCAGLRFVRSCLQLLTGLGWLRVKPP